MTFPVEIVLKGSDSAVTTTVRVPHGEPGTWDEGAVRDVLIEVLRAVAHADNPETASGRHVVLQGFSWIVEPTGEGQVVIGIEIPMGAAVAGPFAIGQSALDAMITRVLKAERQTLAPVTIH